MYEYDDGIVLAVNVALAAGRPLLVRGEPGTGKSSLARSVAHHLGWPLYPVTVSSRSTARDLLWSFDTVARLADAQAGASQIRPRSAYLTPGVLWWAFDRNSALRRGLSQTEFAAQDKVSAATDPAAAARSPDLHPTARAVVLIDEIDKADPDVPNDLLLPLGSFQFALEDGSLVAAAAPPLVIITTNEERDLPKAFLRRCVVLSLTEPDAARLRRIAALHFPELPDATVMPLITAYHEIRQARIAQGDVAPSVAEFLDAVAACSRLASSPTSVEWPQLADLLLAKPALQGPTL